MRRSGLLALVALTACESPPSAPPSGHWTLADMVAASLRGEKVVVGAEGTPDGLPTSTFLRSATPRPVVPVSLAFTEGGFSPYITTNLWANVPKVWIQPMYILVKDWNGQRGTVLPGSRWIFTVGPQSRFHSPFWQVFFAEVPGDTPPDKYTSSEQLFRDKVPLHAGPGRLVALAPGADTAIEALDASRPWLTGVHAATPVTVRSPADYLDGERVTSIDFGENRFRWNEDGEVLEQPFFVLATRRPGEAYEPSKAPNVGGTGPLFQRSPAIAPGNRPIFGSFWRLYLVLLPEGKEAAVFVPPAQASHAASIEAEFHALEARTISWTPQDPATLAAMNRHFLQVALNAGTCFESEATFKDCRWLDSQRAIEELLPLSIVRTGITVTCPFVGYDGQPVPK